MDSSSDEITRMTRGVKRQLDRSRRLGISAMHLMADQPKAEVGTTPCDVVLKRDRMRLLHYHGGPENKAKPPILLVYALINRPYILDLQQDRSVVQALLRQGLDVYMIDWGKPMSGDRFLGMEDYVERYMDDCVERMMAISGQESLSMLGYCIGGYLASIYAYLHSEKIRNLAVMASPLDFDVDHGLLHLWTKTEYFNPNDVVEAFGNAPSDFLNGGFLMLDPLGNTLLKYINFLENLDDLKFVEMFLRMERWLSDGIPVAGTFYIDLIRDGYQRNLFVKNKLRVNGGKADIDKLTMPLLAIVAERDHIVPPESTLGLLDVAPSSDKTTMSFPTGHIGLSVGGEPHQTLWPKVARWFLDRSNPRTAGR